VRQVFPSGPATGLVGVLVLLATLQSSVEFHVRGWTVGIGCGVALAVVLAHGLAAAGRDTLLPADRVTLTRAVLVCGVAGLTADAAPTAPGAHTAVSASGGVLVALCAVALLLDAVDGQVARRTRTVSPLGARFDMETDAFLILVLSIHVARDLGWWVLGIGAARYFLLLVRLAGRWMPWLRGQVPPRRWRKAVAAHQGIALTVATAEVLPATAVSVVVAAGLALLLVSFGTEVVMLRRQARQKAVVVETPVAWPVAPRPLGEAEVRSLT
jgi:phosphatidylglycerophosphate synthase